jgi:hypothetical protein
MKKFFKTIYKYISGINFVDIAYELNIDRHTVRDIADLIRNLICDYVTERNELLGGFDENDEPKIVEIDESMF